jgi:hypothetical protein
LELGKLVKLGENVDGNAKTVNRGENVERVRHRPTRPDTVHTAENWAKNVDEYAKNG